MYSSKININLFSQKQKQQQQQKPAQQTKKMLDGYHHQLSVGDQANLDRSRV